MANQYFLCGRHAAGITVGVYFIQDIILQTANFVKKIAVIIYGYTVFGWVVTPEETQSKVVVGWLALGIR